MKTIVLANAKGGTGKTTCAVNLSACLALHHGKRVLGIDLDPQGNFGISFGVDPRQLTHTAYHLLTAEALDVRYIVLPNTPGIPPRGIPQEGIPPYGEAMPQRGTESQYGIPQHGSNKNNKDTNTNTHTKVSVGSRFSLEECQRYAAHLKTTGQGIINPGGYATKIYRSGEADSLIEDFLNPKPKMDVSKCPDCEGKGYYFPDPAKPETVRCKHQRLQI